MTDYEKALRELDERFPTMQFTATPKKRSKPLAVVKIVLIFIPVWSSMIAAPFLYGINIDGHGVFLGICAGIVFAFGVLGYIFSGVFVLFRFVMFCVNTAFDALETLKGRNDD